MKMTIDKAFKMIEEGYRQIALIEKEGISKWEHNEIQILLKDMYCWNNKFGLDEIQGSMEDIPQKPRRLK